MLPYGFVGKLEALKFDNVNWNNCMFQLINAPDSIYRSCSNKRPGVYLEFRLKGGRLIEVGAYYVFLSTNCNFILAKSLIEKQKLQHYPRKRNVNSNVFRL